MKVEFCPLLHRSSKFGRRNGNGCKTSYADHLYSCFIYQMKILYIIISKLKPIINNFFQKTILNGT